MLGPRKSFTSITRLLFAIVVLNTLSVENTQGVNFKKWDYEKPFDVSQELSMLSQNDYAKIVTSFPRRQYMYRPDQPNTVYNSGVAKEVKIKYPENYLKTKLKNLLKIKEQMTLVTKRDPYDPEFQ